MNQQLETPQPALAGRRVLIFDDDRLNARILTGILNPDGYELPSAHSGEEALQTYDEFRPDLVLLDVMMPGLNGFDTCRTLKSRHGELLAPVIFITAKMESEDVAEGLAAGGVDYLPKPIKAREVLARLRTQLEKRLCCDNIAEPDLGHRVRHRAGAAFCSPGDRLSSFVPSPERTHGFQSCYRAAIHHCLRPARARTGVEDSTSEP